MTIPKYINCKTNEDICDYLFDKSCENRCPYVMSLGIGAKDIGNKKGLEGEINKFLNEDLNLERKELK